MIQAYREMGSRSKKTGQLPYYQVTRNIDTHQWTCTCPAFEFRRHSDCKHIKNLKYKLRLTTGVTE